MFIDTWNENEKEKMNTPSHPQKKTGIVTAP